MRETVIKDLSFSYPGTDKLVLKDINRDVAEGEFVSILGQSGCGKSTLLRLLAGLEKQTSGEILIDGKPFSGPSLSRGVVFQDYGLFPWMTAGENIMLALRQRFPERDKKELREVAVNMLQSVGLDKGVYNKLPKELSGGMKQRLSLARAFLRHPKLFIFDEITANLDEKSRDFVLTNIESYAKSIGAGIIYISHDSCVVNRCEKVVTLDNKLRKKTSDESSVLGVA